MINYPLHPGNDEAMEKILAQYDKGLQEILTKGMEAAQPVRSQRNLLFWLGRKLETMGHWLLFRARHMRGSRSQIHSYLSANRRLIIHNHRR